MGRSEHTCLWLNHKAAELFVIYLNRVFWAKHIFFFKQKLNIIKLWNHLYLLSNIPLSKRLFHWCCWSCQGGFIGLSYVVNLSNVSCFVWLLNHSIFITPSTSLCEQQVVCVCVCVLQFSCCLLASLSDPEGTGPKANLLCLLSPRWPCPIPLCAHTHTMWWFWFVWFPSSEVGACVCFCWYSIMPVKCVWMKPAGLPLPLPCPPLRPC